MAKSVDLRTKVAASGKGLLFRIVEFSRDQLDWTEHARYPDVEWLIHQSETSKRHLDSFKVRCIFDILILPVSTHAHVSRP